MPLCTFVLIFSAIMQIFSSDWGSFDGLYMMGIFACISCAVIWAGDKLKTRDLLNLVAWLLLAYAICIRLEIPALLGIFIPFPLLFLAKAYEKKPVPEIEKEQ